MDGILLAWWLGLCAAATCNVALWILSARRLARRAPQMPDWLAASRRTQLWLSAGYVLGCGFRSVLPMVDVPRICLHDTFISRIAVGRTVATIAELCFAMQWALLLREAGAGKGIAAMAGRVIFPLIVAAEVFSWAAVVTSNYILHAVENSLWALAAVLGLAGLLAVRSRVDPGAARFVQAAIVCAAGYVTYMAAVDVPMYVTRWLLEAGGDGSLPAAEGLRTLLARCTVEPRWTVWRYDMSWLSLYFTVAVWISIAAAHAPRLGNPK